MTRRIVTYDLFGWAEIAEFLGCHMRTAKRYAYDQKMPVAWFNGRVRARREELDAWLDSVTVRNDR